MATPALATQPRIDVLAGGEPRRYAAGLITALTAAALVVHGFHPYAEDGGLYLAGVKRVLDPALFAGNPEFVLGHLRFSVFAPAMAGMVKASGLPLDTIVLLVHLLSIWTTLAAAWMLASRCFERTTQRTCSVTLLAVWLTLPIAGTSLMLMDPYVTARSISTPLTVLALVGAVDFLRSVYTEESWNWKALVITLVSLLGAAFVHPLMAGYGFVCVLTLVAVSPRRTVERTVAIAALSVAAIIVATTLRLAGQAESSSYRDVALSRYYWFLSQWHWYELLGAVAPLTILAVIAWRKRYSDSAQHGLALMSVVAGSISILIALLFARVDATNHLVARMQPMRTFQLIYIVMIILLGGWLARWLGTHTLRWTATFGLLAAVMILSERATFPQSDRIEVSENRATTQNNWVQAFEWIRDNTPKNALFALDADYITRPGEDAQVFRAIAERNALPDYSKDGGEAAITPALTDNWRAGQQAQEHLSERSDQDRINTLASRNVSWVVLESHSTTSFACPYSNAAVKVCQLPENITQATNKSFQPGH